MLRVLEFEQTKSETLRDTLRKSGIVCQQADRAFTVPNREGLDVFGALWRYNFPGTGQPIWIIEIVVCLRNDTITRSWVLDAAPTQRQVDAIIMNNAQAGTMIK